MKKIFLLVALFIFSLSVAGCGGSDSAPPPTVDTIPPTVLSVTPFDSAQAQALRPTISLTFNEAMDQGSVETAFSSVPTLPPGTFSRSGNTVSYTPDADLSYSTTYSITVGTGAKDVVGNPLANAYSWSFTTRNAPDTTPPTIDSVTPTNGATGVSASSTISVTFSEAMNQASVEAAFSTSPVVAGSFTWAGNTMTFTPSTALGEATTYSITMGNGAKDLAENPLASAYTWSWRTALPYKVINLQSAFAVQTSNSGVVPSLDGKYIFWWDNTVEENTHLYRVKISDLSSQTIWTNRTFSAIYDDGVNAWVGSYNPYGSAAKIPDSDPLSYAVNNGLPVYHCHSLNGNKLDFANVYFGTSSGDGISYWNRSSNAAGRVSGSEGAYLYQSAVIGNKIYFPRGYVSSPGIMVVDAANNPTALETTLLAGDTRIERASDIYTDGVYLYVLNGNTNEIQKIDTTGTGSIVATFAPGVTFTNPAMVGNYVYSGVYNNKNVYIMDKATGTVVTKDCSAYLPTPVGAPRWDFYNDGIWYGPQGGSTDVRKAYFIPRSVIDNNCS